MMLTFRRHHVPRQREDTFFCAASQGLEAATTILNEVIYFHA
jgi:hypothetical protein